MKDHQIGDKEIYSTYEKTQKEWKKRTLLDVNLLPFDEVCANLIITNSINNNANETIHARIFNNQESINIGCLIIPNQFDQTNTLEQFIVNFESNRNLFDAILLMSEDSTFADFGFKKIISNDENNAVTHYRSNSLYFEDFKGVFKPKSIIVMKAAVTSGPNRALEAIVSTFTFPDFFGNKNIEIKNTIISITSGITKCTNDELNNISQYSHKKIKIGEALITTTLEDLSLGNKIKLSALISCFAA